MGHIQVKICGITGFAAARAAAACSADAVGFVFAPSPRQVSPERARELAGVLPPHIRRVAVLRHPTGATVERVLRVLQPDWLQSDAEDFDALELPPECRKLPVYRACGISGAESRVADPMLFEGPDSGRGQLADWDKAARLAKRTRLILAGGLTPDNVGEAVRRVRPFGVDVSSGVERSPGVKDPDRIEAFISAVRRAESEIGDSQ